jgi:hypothetical protein
VIASIIFTHPVTLQGSSDSQRWFQDRSSTRRNGFVTERWEPLAVTLAGLTSVAPWVGTRTSGLPGVVQVARGGFFIPG